MSQRVSAIEAVSMRINDGTATATAAPSSSFPSSHATSSSNPATGNAASVAPLHTLPPPPSSAAPVPSGGAPPSAAPSSAPPPSAAVRPIGQPSLLSGDQRALVRALLHADVHALKTKFNKTDWNFDTPVIGRTRPQTPLGLLLRPELNYGNLSRMSQEDQFAIVEHVLRLPHGYTPRLDSLDKNPPFRQTMNASVLQCVYQGRVDLLELLCEVAAERARSGTGVAFDLRERFFATNLSLLHMAAHDGRLEMSRWLVARWNEERERDPASPKSIEFHADLPDAAGQTPLFWTFARGSLNVELARFFVDECGCDFFRVVRLKPNPGSSVRDFYASAFSLSIELAPAFAEEQLRTRCQNMGTRFQLSVFRHDFRGITLRAPQIALVQDRVDHLNARRAEDKTVSSSGPSRSQLEGRMFLDEAKRLVKDWLAGEKARREKKRAEKIRIARAGGKVEDSERSASPTAATNAEAQDEEDDAAGRAIPDDELDMHELRFVSLEAQGDRPVKDRWDSFFYNSLPLSAVELMVRHGRRNLLLTPIMKEVQTRLWQHLRFRYLAMLAAYFVTGLMFALNTGLWPRSTQLIDGVWPATPLAVDSRTWVALFFVDNLVPSLFCLLLLLYHVKAIHNGAHSYRLPDPAPGDPPGSHSRRAATRHFLGALMGNVWSEFRTGSAKLDLMIVLTFAVLQGLQWKLACNVPAFNELVLGCPIAPTLNYGMLTVYLWLSSLLHLLLGAKLLELLSVFSFAGPLFSTLLGMAQDSARFLSLFAVGWAAFACAAWIALREVQKDPSEAAADPSGVGLTDPVAQPQYTYSEGLTAVLLWFFLSFDFDLWLSIPSELSGVAALGRVVFLVFLVSLSLVMLNAMIAMYSATYARVEAAGPGEWQLRASAVLCSLLRTAGAASSVARDFVLEMAVDNNCGVDREGSGAEAEADAEGTADAAAEERQREREQTQLHFQLLQTTVARLRQEVKQLQESVKAMAQSKAERKADKAAEMRSLSADALDGQ